MTDPWDDGIFTYMKTIKIDQRLVNIPQHSPPRVSSLEPLGWDILPVAGTNCPWRLPPRHHNPVCDFLWGAATSRHEDAIWILWTCTTAVAIIDAQRELRIHPERSNCGPCRQLVGKDQVLLSTDANKTQLGKCLSVRWKWCERSGGSPPQGEASLGRSLPKAEHLRVHNYLLEQ